MVFAAAAGEILPDLKHAGSVVPVAIGGTIGVIVMLLLKSIEERMQGPLGLTTIIGVEKIRASPEGAAAQRNRSRPPRQEQRSRTFPDAAPPTTVGTGRGRWDGATLSAIIAGRMWTASTPTVQPELVVGLWTALNTRGRFEALGAAGQASDCRP
ncbi:hypothetical protein MESS2_740027 [Mesorhizobium metallidurans STM 2683]|uniref:Uncharacterized protein n=1 Tax=Mesorhizobium metallidurans STM 2683 TaxID=1297569 RepID=M5EWQ9_9HYPH|nr:hypothetical protein MESS2_740027 [Mesorhizobium metallidurans STM 2683]